MMLRESMTLAGLGVLIGIPAGIVLSRYLENLLYGIDPLDAWVIATTSAGLLLVSAVAGWIPANRAARIQPLAALRCE